MMSESDPSVYVLEPAGEDLFTLPATFRAALPEPEAAVRPATHLQPHARP